VVDYVFLTTGHVSAPFSAEEDALRNAVSSAPVQYYPRPYPTSQLDGIKPRATVAVQGSGLTAHDILAELTVGRGGQYFRTERGFLTYKPSGGEPTKIVLFSSSGVPHCARAKNEKGLAGRHFAGFLTDERVLSLRANGAVLCFQTDVLPLIETEMRHAYWLSHLSNAGVDDSTIEDFRNNHVNAKDALERERVCRAAAETCMHSAGATSLVPDFSWELLEHPLAGFPVATPAEVDASVIQWLEQDLAEARRGNVSSPYKAAADVLRDTRDQLRGLIGFCGLSTESSSDFKRFLSVMNRVAVGPPLLRNEQLLALHRAGIVDVSAGPNASISFDSVSSAFSISSTVSGQHPTHCDVFIQARIDGFDIATSEAPLMKALRGNGLVRRYEAGGYVTGGIEVTPDGNGVVDCTGRARSNLVAMGVIAEGCNFYTFVLPRPMVKSRSLMDAGLAAKRVMELACKAQKQNCSQLY